MMERIIPKFLCPNCNHDIALHRANLCEHRNEGNFTQISGYCSCPIQYADLSHLMLFEVLRIVAEKKEIVLP